MFFLQVYVQCMTSTGTYKTPVVSSNYVYNLTRPASSLYQAGKWPNCTTTIKCGQPPDAPMNGSIQWLSGASTFQGLGKYF